MWHMDFSGLKLGMGSQHISGFDNWLDKGGLIDITRAS